MKRAGLWLLVMALSLVAALLAYGGVVLLGSGGSPWYLLAGIAVALTAGLLARPSPRAVPVYGLFLAATLGWSFWEVGLDGWALAPRLIGPCLVGLLVLGASPGASRWWVRAPVIAGLGAIVLAAVIAKLPDWRAPSPPASIAHQAQAPTEWRHWGGTLAGTRYVAASQIDRANVSRLTRAWTFDPAIPPQPIVSFEGTPLLADGRLYACLQPGIVAALDPDSGRQLWRFTAPGYARADFTGIFGGKCRGVSYHESPHPHSPSQLPACTRRVLFSAPPGELRAVDAATGRPCPGFGKEGAVDLREGMGLKSDRLLAMPSSPPAIVKDVAVVGQTVSDMQSLDAPSGVVRGYDAVTGELKWAWDAGRPGQTRLAPGETYTPDTPNAWGVMSGDEALGLVFVPTGNSLPDYYGGARDPKLEKYATSVVALDVATGQVRWSFQAVRHDLWDYDLASQPVSVELDRYGQKIPALIVPTKQGEIFVLDRRTGKPVDRVQEREVPRGGVPGERVSPTQPVTTGFPSLAGPDLTEADTWGITPLDQLWCRIRFRQARYQGRFTPVGLTDTLMYPGTAGGINWGSVTIDPVRGLMLVNTLRFANFGRLIRRQDAPKGASGGSEGNVIFEMAGTPYAFTQTPFLSPLGIPCQRPPFGTIHAFDLATRAEVWRRSLGTGAKAGPFGIESHIPLRLGAPNMGGSVATAGGLAFIGAAQDRKIRAFDIETGKVLWSDALPAVAAATPMSYVSPRTGRQYVVIAAGGHYGLPGPARMALIAYALPR